MIDYKYRILCEIYKGINISETALRLNLEQGTISKILKKIEEEIGEKLFVRTPKKMIPTSFGLKFMDLVSHYQKDYDSKINQLRKDKSSFAGKFKLGCHQIVAFSALKNSFSKIQENYEKIEIDLEFYNSNVVCEKVISGALDLGIVASAKKHPDLVIKKLYTENACLYSFG